MNGHATKNMGTDVPQSSRDEPMPIKINFLQNGAGIEFVSSGIVTGEEIVAANRKIYNRENLGRLKYKVIDRTNCTEYRVTAEDIAQIAEQDRQAAQINADLTIVLIAPTDLQYGMTRMWQAYIDDIGFTSKVFSIRSEANAYLAEKFPA